MTMADVLDVDALLAPPEGGDDPRADPSAVSPYRRVKDARSDARDEERARDAEGEEEAPLAEGWRTVLRVGQEVLLTAKDFEVASWLTEALVRSFMFADSSVKDEIHHVGMLLTTMLTRAISPGEEHEPTDDDVAIARVIGDVWLSALVGWVTGRASAEDLDDQMDVAVRLLLR